MTEPKNGREFARIVLDKVRETAPGWGSKEIKEWLRGAGARFGDPAYGWTRADAEDTALIFLEDASTW